jgi:hypothetical protein
MNKTMKLLCMMFLAIAGTLMTSCSTDDNPVGHPTIHGENDKVIDLKDLLECYTSKDWTYYLQDGCILTSSIKSDGEVDSPLRFYYGTFIIPDGATVTLRNFNTKTRRIICEVYILCKGSATIIIEGCNDIYAYKHPSIEVGGEGTTLTIRGNGSLTVNGDYGFAAIGSVGGNSCGDINIESGHIEAKKGVGAYCCIGRSNESDKGGKVSVGLNVFSDGIRDDFFNFTLDKGDNNTLFLSLLESDVVLTEDVKLKGRLGGDYKISIADGVSVSLSDVTISANDWAGITCEGSATIILNGYNSVSSSKKSGIQFSRSDKTLTIMGDGSLDVSAGDHEAGIGANGNCGNINIECSGVINASCAGSGVGIGSVSGSCGDITVGLFEIGTIYAQGSETPSTIPGVSIPTEGVGIGSHRGNCGNITIFGTVHATGGNNGVGIGSFGGSCGYIDIEGSGSASGGELSDYMYCIGANNISMARCGSITINGTLYWDGSNFQNNGEKYLRTSPLSW